LPFTAPKSFNQRDEKEEACQQKDQTPGEHKRFSADNTSGDEEKGTGNKKNPAIQLISSRFVATIFFFIAHTEFFE